MRRKVSLLPRQDKVGPEASRGLPATGPGAEPNVQFLPCAQSSDEPSHVSGNLKRTPCSTIGRPVLRPDDTALPVRNGTPQMSLVTV